MAAGSDDANPTRSPAVPSILQPVAVRWKRVYGVDVRGVFNVNGSKEFSIFSNN